jgi:hypothetical protein
MFHVTPARQACPQSRQTGRDGDTGVAPESRCRRVPGVAPGGVPLDSLMPVQMTKDMTDTEIDAVWAYIRTMLPAPMGK